MIFTIKGAKFATANLGTLTSQSVKKFIGQGATYNIPDVIDRDTENVVWTITLDANYIFGSYVITMGTNTITPIIDGNVMTITIAKVTGSININVNTIYQSQVENMYTFTINTTPAYSNVVLTAEGYTQQGNSITVAKDISVEWEVSKVGYETQSGTEVITEDLIKDVVLSEISSGVVTREYEIAGYVKNDGSITVGSSPWVHSDFILISSLTNDAEGYCTSGLQGHGSVASVAYYSESSDTAYISCLQHSVGEAKRYTAEEIVGGAPENALYITVSTHGSLKPVKVTMTV